ncbi:MAG: hypothetical protein KIT85_18045 [Pseudolabrys sp.]|nr:hypothetical protein [Pseudolabrys sp.]MCW5686301.1 hypothetical protein [Pseudolabrys sp.]
MSVSASAALSSSAAALYGNASSSVPWAQTLTNSMLSVYGSSSGSSSTLDSTDYSTVFSDAILNYYSGLNTLAGKAALTRIQNEAAAKMKANSLDLSI